MGNWSVLVVVVALGCAPRAQDEPKLKKLEASGVVRRADELLIVDDGVPGTLLHLRVTKAEGVLRFSPEQVRLERIPGAELAIDLEGVALAGERVFVLSERLGALVGADGTRYEYASNASVLGNRGLEGLAIRPSKNGSYRVAALFEGGYPKPSAMHSDLREPLQTRALAPFVIVHQLPDAGASEREKDDKEAEQVELRMAGLGAKLDPGQRFRAVDLVWHELQTGDWSWIVLLSSDAPPAAASRHAHLWLQRFDTHGRPMGEHFDLGAWLEGQGQDKHELGDWEGLGWWQPGSSLVLVEDTGKARSQLAFVPLPADWNRAPERDRGLGLHFDSLVMDGHNDLPWALRERAAGDFEALDIALPQPELHTDIPRLRAGGLGAQFWSVYVPTETQKQGLAAQQTFEQIDLVLRMIERYPDSFELAQSAADIERIWRAGRIASMMGIEGGYSIQDSLALLRIYHRLGVRYMTLTHADTISWADSATDDPMHGGLSAFGEEVVREMNRVGMLVDLSHVSEETMRDALRVSQAPVIASHSCAYALAPHARNIPDDVLKLIAENGGVVMVNFFPGFVVRASALAMGAMFDARRDLLEQHGAGAEFDAAWSAWSAAHPMEAGTLSDLVDHIDHIAKLAGIEHVGLGSDYDGVPLLPRGLEDVSSYPAITQELLLRGYKKQEVRQVLGLNVLRALKKAEQVARELGSKGPR